MRSRFTQALLCPLAYWKHQEAPISALSLDSYCMPFSFTGSLKSKVACKCAISKCSVTVTVPPSRSHPISSFHDAQLYEVCLVDGHHIGASLRLYGAAWNTSLLINDLCHSYYEKVYDVCFLHSKLRRITVLSHTWAKPFPNFTPILR